jgi:hypothetical protein
LRDFPDEAELAEMYAIPHDAKAWGAGHQLRVDATVALGCTMVDLDDTSVVADLSCGNAEIPRRIAEHFECGVWLGDFAPGPRHSFTGPIEVTVEYLRDSLGPDDDHVDLFICSETIEHLADPWLVLERIGSVAERLLLSTPIDELDGSGTPEHIWGWGTHDVERMLLDTGWTVTDSVLLLPHEGYEYQIHLAEWS